MKRGVKNLITFWQNSNKLKDEGNLGNYFEDLNTAGDQNEMCQRLPAFVQKDLKNLLSFFFHCCEVTHLIG